MPFFEDVIVSESLQIETRPEAIFDYLTTIVDDESFKTLNANNVSFRWLKGPPWTAGSVAYAEKYLHGKLHKFKFIVTKIVPNRHIEYMPTSWFMRKFFPKKAFIIETEGKGCRFVSSATFRIGWIGNVLFKKSIEKGLSDFRMYLREEGENLKRILESP